MGKPLSSVIALSVLLCLVSLVVKVALAQDISSLINEATFNNMLKHRGEGNCRGRFYTYNSFLTAARSFGGFATTGDPDTLKREIIAFFAQTSHETTDTYTYAAEGEKGDAD
ncbi:hypothetical protein Scep_009918 [Stephania cephalantha]|uniref:Glycoside hydrolase family 19 catalytic domain-containing protein n=1 Tax=Stephania cephalantha TaxID=152367 RepID=A0AAP0JWI9_9MAGN